MADLNLANDFDSLDGLVEVTVQRQTAVDVWETVASTPALSPALATSLAPAGRVRLPNQAAPFTMPGRNLPVGIKARDRVIAPTGEVFSVQDNPGPSYSTLVDEWTGTMSRVTP